MAFANKIVPEHASCNHDRKAMVEVFDRLGNNWTIMIVAALHKGPLQYGELHRQIGDISQRMLTLTLRGLTEDGLVSRTVCPTIPPRVDYELTKLGTGLRASLIPLRDWASQNIGAIAASRAMNRDRSA